MLTGDADRMRFTDAKAKEMDYGARRSVIRDIGEKSAAGEDPTTDPAMARFLEQVDEQYLKMVEGSHKMQSDLTVLPAANRKQLEQLKHDYVLSDLSFTGSTMTASGSTISIVFGNASGTPQDVTSAATMIWSTFKGTATESGPADIDF